MTEFQRQTFIRLARCAATQSDDPSTQNAAQIGLTRRANHVPFPGLTGEERERLQTDRDWKLGVVEHAERAVIHVAGGHGEVMYALWAPCPDCARAIVQAGVRRLYTLDMPTPPRWRELVELGEWIVKRGGVTHVKFPLPHPKLGVTILFDREPLDL